MIMSSMGNLTCNSSGSHILITFLQPILKYNKPSFLSVLLQTHNSITAQPLFFKIIQIPIAPNPCIASITISTTTCTSRFC